MITVHGAHGIYATVLKHSISPAGVNLITLEISYPRIVLAELNTHRMLCKNSSSSRAIPFQKMMDQLFGRPVRFGQANAGMQDKGEDFDAPVTWEEVHEGGKIVERSVPAEVAWEMFVEEAAEWSRRFYTSGFHKQIYNRLTEAGQMMKTVATWTEGANFFWLRNHDAADPSLAELARVMYEAASQSVPQELFPGEWHLPYVITTRDDTGVIRYWIETETPGVKNMLILDQAVKVSCARTAAVSFRNVDYGVEKSEEVYNRLVTDERVHGSATEHQATPMQPSTEAGENAMECNIPTWPVSWEHGITHMTRDRELWSGPLKGWIQHRKLIAGENKGGFI